MPHNDLASRITTSLRAFARYSQLFALETVALLREIANAVVDGIVRGARAMTTAVSRVVDAIVETITRILRGIEHFFLSIEHAICAGVAELLCFFWAIRPALVLVLGELALIGLAFRYPLLWFVAIPALLVFAWVIQSMATGAQDDPGVGYTTEDTKAVARRVRIGLRVAVAVGSIIFMLVRYSPLLISAMSDWQSQGLGISRQKPIEGTTESTTFPSTLRRGSEAAAPPSRVTQRAQETGDVGSPGIPSPSVPGLAGSIVRSTKAPESLLSSSTSTTPDPETATPLALPSAPATSTLPSGLAPESPPVAPIERYAQLSTSIGQKWAEADRAAAGGAGVAYLTAAAMLEAALDELGMEVRRFGETDVVGRLRTETLSRIAAVRKACEAENTGLRIQNRPLLQCPGGSTS